MSVKQCKNIYKKIDFMYDQQLKILNKFNVCILEKNFDNK